MVVVQHSGQRVEGPPIFSGRIVETLNFYPARALRALGLLLADGTPTGGRGEDFLSRQPDFFYGNSCNFGTKSRKIVSKVGN